MNIWARKNIEDILILREGTHISFLVLRLKQVEEEYIVTTQLPVAIDEEFGLRMFGLLIDCSKAI